MAPPEDETLVPSGSLLSGSNESSIGFNTTRTTYHMKDIEPPKLKSTCYDDYHRWKIDIEWWADLNRLEKRLQAPYVIMNAIIDPEVYEIATKMPRVDARQKDGLDRSMLVLDEHVKPNTFIRKVALWHEFRRLEKTPGMTWISYLKKMKKTRTDLGAHYQRRAVLVNDPYQRPKSGCCRKTQRGEHG